MINNDNNDNLDDISRELVEKLREVEEKQEQDIQKKYDLGEIPGIIVRKQMVTANQLKRNNNKKKKHQRMFIFRNMSEMTSCGSSYNRR